MTSSPPFYHNIPSWVADIHNLMAKYYLEVPLLQMHEIDGYFG